MEGFVSHQECWKMPQPNLQVVSALFPIVHCPGSLMRFEENIIHSPASRVIYSCFELLVRET